MVGTLIKTNFITNKVKITFCCLLIFSTSFTRLFSGMPSASNSWDPVQDQHFVSPNLVPNCLQRLSADDKNHMISIWVTKVGLRIQVSDSGPSSFI